MKVVGSGSAALSSTWLNHPTPCTYFEYAAGGGPQPQCGATEGQSFPGKTNETMKERLHPTQSSGCNLPLLNLIESMS